VTSMAKPLPLLPLTRPLEQGTVTAQRQYLRQHMTACRASTLALVQPLTEAEYFRQAHPDFSPVGWHLGHIAFTEALWLLEHLAGQPNPWPSIACCLLPMGYLNWPESRCLT
jgi:hypothetical protein